MAFVLGFQILLRSESQLNRFLATGGRAGRSVRKGGLGQREQDPGVVGGTPGVTKRVGATEGPEGSASAALGRLTRAGTLPGVPLLSSRRRRAREKPEFQVPGFPGQRGNPSTAFSGAGRGLNPPLLPPPSRPPAQGQVGAEVGTLGSCPHRSWGNLENGGVSPPAPCLWPGLLESLIPVTDSLAMRDLRFAVYTQGTKLQVSMKRIYVCA